MFSPTDLQQELLALRQRRTDARAFATAVLNSLGQAKNAGLDPQQLDADKIVHLQDIKQLCIDYRLRFLPATYFKGEWPVEAVDKIQQLEAEHGTELSDLRIVAPAKRLRLENAAYPALVQWLYDLEYRHGVSILDLSLTPATASGRLMVSLRVSK